MKDKRGIGMKKFEEKTVQSTEIFKGKVVTLTVDDVILPNGKPAKREIIHHPGAVAIIPITKDGKIVFVEQYRKALERTIVEIPAGKLEPGEEPAVCARRELEEETGYGAKELTHIQSFYTSLDLPTKSFTFLLRKICIKLKRNVNWTKMNLFPSSKLPLKKRKKW